MKRDIGRKSSSVHAPPAFDAPAVGGPCCGGGPDRILPWRLVGLRETRNVWLPDGEKNLKICSLVSTEYTSVTDTQMDRRTDGRTEWTDAVRRQRARLCIASRGNSNSWYVSLCRLAWLRWMTSDTDVGTVGFMYTDVH